MTTHIRDLQPGDRFYLLRSMERFTYTDTTIVAGKRRHVVLREGDNKSMSLHHSCHIKRIVRAA